MGTYSHKQFECPFYKGDRRRGETFTISCEGGLVRLPGRKAFNAFTDACCCGEWRQCTIARALKRYYENETPGH